MNPAFAVHASSHYERLSATLKRRSNEFAATERAAVEILCHDPLNHSRHHHIKKLRDVAAGDGQYRLALGRWRFRFDFMEKTVILKHCGLRRENTY
jgi:hypothetical protein